MQNALKLVLGKVNINWLTVLLLIVQYSRLQLTAPSLRISIGILFSNSRKKKQMTKATRYINLITI